MFRINSNLSLDICAIHRYTKMLLADRDNLDNILQSCGWSDNDIWDLFTWLWNHDNNHNNN